MVLANQDFVNDGRSASSSKGMPHVKVVAESVPCECSEQEIADAGVKAAMPQIIDALTKPLGAEEASPKTKEREKLARIAFKGQLDEETLRAFWGERLVDYQRPSVVFFVESLPRNAMGKVLLDALREAVRGFEPLTE